MGKWCCEAMRYAFDDRHDRSIFVFAEHANNNLDIPITFWIAMRSVEQQHLKTLNEKEWPKDISITIGARRRILYCPWCGKKLEKFYKRNYQQMIDEEIIAEYALPTK